MDDLYKKIEALRDMAKALLAKPGQNSLVPALKHPTIKPLSMPSVSGGAPSKIPGVTPPSGKDPKKMAEQLKNPRPKKVKMEVLKTAKNGQWSLEKSADDYSVSHHSSYNHDNGTVHQFSIHHRGKHVASGYVHEPGAGHKAEPTVISPEHPKHAAHVNIDAKNALHEAAQDHLPHGTRFGKADSGIMTPDGDC